MEFTIEVPDGMTPSLRFSLMRPVGSDRYDVPALLRQLAGTLEELNVAYSVENLVFKRTWVTGDEDEDDLPMLTVYLRT